MIASILPTLPLFRGVSATARHGCHGGDGKWVDCPFPTSTTIHSVVVVVPVSRGCHDVGFSLALGLDEAPPDARHSPDVMNTSRLGLNVAFCLPHLARTSNTRPRCHRIETKTPPSLNPEVAPLRRSLGGCQGMAELAAPPAEAVCSKQKSWLPSPLACPRPMVRSTLRSAYPRPSHPLPI